MSVITRLQYVFHHSAGEVVSSTRLTFNGEENEFLTTASIAFLIGEKEGDIWGMLNQHGLIMMDKNGQRWVAMQEVNRLFHLILF